MVQQDRCEFLKHNQKVSLKKVELGAAYWSGFPDLLSYTTLPR